MVIRGIIYLYHLITYPIRSTVKAQTFSDDYRDLLSKRIRVLRSVTHLPSPYTMK
jgi:hypothetical protein